MAWNADAEMQPGTCLLVQEFKVCCALIGNITILYSLSFILVGPFDLSVPVVLLVSLILVVIIRKVRFLRGILAI